jgi:hypothetical protein
MNPDSVHRSAGVCFAREKARHEGRLSVGILGTSKILPIGMDSENWLRNIEPVGGPLIFSQSHRRDTGMATCAECNQPIKETVIVGRKLIAQVHSGRHVPPETGRYLTVLNLTCACGVRVVRRYENRPLPEYSTLLAAQPS